MPHGSPGVIAMVGTVDINVLLQSGLKTDRPVSI